jgi:putative PIN family toxin of toxin-antitoxin system
MNPAPTVLVLDTNVVLDLFVYEDPATAALRDRLADPRVRWLATPVMREELRRVLDYPQVVKRLEARGLEASQVLSAFDARTTLTGVAPKAPYTCKDGDDQPFIDLAVQHTATLLSKDKAVLCMRKRLATLGVAVSRQWPACDPAAGAGAPAPRTAAA